MPREFGLYDVDQVWHLIQDEEMTSVSRIYLYQTLVVYMECMLLSHSVCWSGPTKCLWNQVWHTSMSATEFGPDSLHSKCIIYCHGTGCITQIQYLQIANTLKVATSHGGDILV